MASARPLSAFPFANTSPPIYVATDSVEILKRWVWMVQEWRIDIALLWSGPVSTFSLDGAFTVAAGENFELGSDLALPFPDEKHLLDYRGWRRNDSDTVGGVVSTFDIRGGAGAYWTAMRSGGALITSGGDYRYVLNMDITLTDDGGTSTLTNNPAASDPSVAAASFDGVAIDLFTNGPADFSGTVDITPITFWGYDGRFDTGTGLPL